MNQNAVSLCCRRDWMCRLKKRFLEGAGEGEVTSGLAELKEGKDGRIIPF